KRKAQKRSTGDADEETSELLNQNHVPDLVPPFTGHLEADPKESIHNSRGNRQRDTFDHFLFMTSGQKHRFESLGPGGRNLKAFGVGGAALKSAVSRDMLDELQIAHAVLILQPNCLALVTGEHLRFQLEHLADVDVELRNKVNARDRIEVVNFGNFPAGCGF